MTARSRNQSQARWRTLIETGPAWHGGDGMVQEDANYEFMQDLVDAAQDLAPLLPRTEATTVQLVEDLVEISKLPIDDSFATLGQGIDEVAAAFTPVFAGCTGPLPDLADAIATAAVVGGSEYFVYPSNDDWVAAPFGMWASALGGDFAAAVAARLGTEVPWVAHIFRDGLLQLASAPRAS